MDGILDPAITSITLGKINADLPMRINARFRSVMEEWCEAGYVEEGVCMIERGA